MTLMNPNPYPRKIHRKNIRTCQNCGLELVVVDGRGRRLYCPGCAKKLRTQANKQAVKAWLKRKKKEKNLAACLHCQDIICHVRETCPDNMFRNLKVTLDNAFG